MSHQFEKNNFVKKKKKLLRSIMKTDRHHTQAKINSSFNWNKIMSRKLVNYI